MANAEHVKILEEGDAACNVSVTWADLDWPYAAQASHVWVKVSRFLFWHIPLE